MQGTKADPIGTAAGAIVGLALLIAAISFAGQWAWSKIDPAGYAASQAASATERNNENAAKAAEADRAREAEAAKLAAEAVQEVYWTHAKDSYESFKRTLNDPYSAQFRDVWMVKFGEEGAVGSAVCGEVNARNGFGAYTGYQPFAATGDLSWTQDHPNFAEQYRTICEEGEKLELMR